MVDRDVNGGPTSDQLDRALLELAGGEPEWVLVDRRVLEILLGPLTDLIVKIPYDHARRLKYFRDLEAVATRRDYDPDADGYIWEDDSLC